MGNPRQFIQQGYNLQYTHFMGGGHFGFQQKFWHANCKLCVDCMLKFVCNNLQIVDIVSKPKIKLTKIHKNIQITICNLILKKIYTLGISVLPEAPWKA